MYKPQLYLTSHGHSLLYVSEPLDVPVLTLENYTKWYNIYLVQPNGDVVEVDSGIILEVTAKYPDARWVDHLYHPRLLYRVAEHLGAAMCERSIEVAAGRWVIESYEFEDECDRFKFHSPALD